MMHQAMISTHYDSLRSLAHLPRAASWLTVAEQAARYQLRDESRRDQWTLARWLSKRMIGAATGRSFSEIEICSRVGRLGCRPRVHVRGRELPWSLSISHTKWGAFVGLAIHDRLSVGVDLAADVPTDDRFCAAWFTSNERNWLRSAPDERAATLWALKEAVFKAFNSGEPWCPRSVEILPSEEGVFQCRYFGRVICPHRIDIRQIDGHTAATVCVRHGAEPRDASLLASWTTCL